MKARMPRKPRIHVPGAFYHVTLRGNHRQDIFFCNEHRRWLDDIVAEAIDRFAARAKGKRTGIRISGISAQSRRQ
jgi:putative transposase